MRYQPPPPHRPPAVTPSGPQKQPTYIGDLITVTSDPEVSSQQLHPLCPNEQFISSLS